MPALLSAHIAQLKRRQSFSEAEAQRVIAILMRGEAAPDEIAALLTAWKDNGVTVDELVGAARAMRALAVPVAVRRGVLVDTCGTGGDGLGTFNISTVSALIVAAAGVRVAKHGNRGATSRCGSADLLEALGVGIDPGPDVVARCINELGIGFLFAPRFHPAMKHVAPVRKQLPFRTIFNLLGPLTNPAGATHQLIGVPDAALLDLLPPALIRLGVTRAMVVCGENGLDEVNPAGVTHVVEIRKGKPASSIMTPATCGTASVPLEALRVTDVAGAVRMAQAVLAGDPGPPLEAAVLNAGGTLYVAGAAQTVTAGVALARTVLRRGLAMEKLEQLKRMTTSS